MKKLFAALLLFSAVWQAGAYPVKGVVRSGNEKINGVVVTDGRSVTLTDEKGRFELEASDDAQYVYICTPSGYHAPIEGGVPRFFQNLSGKKGSNYDFDLVDFSSPAGYAVFAVADPQTADRANMDRFTSETEPDMAALAAEYTAEGIRTVGLYLGDISWDNMDLYSDFKEHMARLGYPVHTVIGNHDFDEKRQGSREASVQFRNNFGPLHYGFEVGGACFVVLNNIRYDTQKKYVEGVDDKQLEWLAEYLKYIPENAPVYVAMHSNLQKNNGNGFHLDNGEELLALFREAGVCNLTFLTGHSHLIWNREIAPGVWEFNSGAACGAWWQNEFAKDGAPHGYRVLEITPKNGIRTYFKSTGRDRDYRYEIFDRGAFYNRPNAVTAKVWDYDSRCRVEWWEDGSYMGEMERFASYDPQYLTALEPYRIDSIKSGFEYTISKGRWPYRAEMFFAGVPSPYAREVEIATTDRYGNVSREKIALRSVDVQAHRGGTGLMPENTIDAMLNAVELGVNTLELDLHMSADGKIVVSHDAYMNHRFMTKPDGTHIDPKEQGEYILYNMTYDSIKRYDAGLKPHPDYPDQFKTAVCKPLLTDLIDAVERYTAENGFSPVNYNIEIKSSEKREVDGTVPPYREFAEAAMEVLLSKELGERLIVQCFDARTLNYIHSKYPGVRLAYLVDEERDDFDDNMALLNFMPDWYSPHYTLVNSKSIKEWKAAGVRVVPWTVDRPEDIKKMVELGVDGIISNYPDRVLKVTRGY